MLNHVLILRKIHVRRKRGFESALSCRKEGTATWCPSAVAFPGFFSRGRWENRCFTYGVIPSLMGSGGATSFRT